MSQFEQMRAAVDVIKRATPNIPKIGVILGSGLGMFADQLQQPTTLLYTDIPHFPQTRVVGHAGQLMVGNLGEVCCVVMRGRSHYYEGHSMETVTFPVRVLAGLGIKTLIVTNAAGGVNPAFKPADIMVITDHINFMGNNPLRGPNDASFGARFPDMSAAYDPACWPVLHDAARDVGVSLREGVYAGMIGPSYETPAEIRMLQRLGVDAVGMSTVPEVIVARHSGLRVVGLSIITNYAAGLSAQTLSHDEVTLVANQVRDKVCNLLAAAIGRLG